MRRAANEFARVISCDYCSRAGFPKLLRDDYINLPQPGYIGSNYRNTRGLLVGQNPAVDNEPEHADAFTALRENPSSSSLRKLKAVQDRLMPGWRFIGGFPFDRCGLRLNDVAFTNVVRCRVEVTPPGKGITKACIDNHLVRWLDWLEPRVVVCIGKWAHDQIGYLVQTRDIRSGFLNQKWNLSGAEREQAVKAVVALVRGAIDDEV